MTQRLQSSPEYQATRTSRILFSPLQVSTPEYKDVPHPATGDMDPPKVENPRGASPLIAESQPNRHLLATASLPRYPQTIPEVANESMGINRSLSSASAVIAVEEHDYKVHRRQSSKGGVASVREPVTSSPAAWSVDGKGVRQASNDRRTPRLPALPEKLKRGFRGKLWLQSRFGLISRRLSLGSPVS